MTGKELKALVDASHAVPLKEFPLSVTDSKVTVYLYSPRQAAIVAETRVMRSYDNRQPRYFTHRVNRTPTGQEYSEMFTVKARARLRSSSGWTDFVVVDVVVESEFVTCPTCKGDSIRGARACSTCNGHSSISRELYERVYAPKQA